MTKRQEEMPAVIAEEENRYSRSVKLRTNGIGENTEVLNEAEYQGWRLVLQLTSFVASYLVSLVCLLLFPFQVCSEPVSICFAPALGSQGGSWPSKTGWAPQEALALPCLNFHMCTSKSPSWTCSCSWALNIIALDSFSLSFVKACCKIMLDFSWQTKSWSHHIDVQSYAVENMTVFLFWELKMWAFGEMSVRRFSL